MAKPKAATFPRLRRRNPPPNQQPTPASISIIPTHPPNDLLQIIPERVSSSHIMLGVVAFLDIRTEDGDDVSKDFEDALIAMGAKVRKTFTDNITHLVFKNGSTSTLQRAYAKSIPVVNLLWITRSQTIGCKLDEKQFSIERPPNLSVGMRRRRKSMEPGRVKELILDPRRFSSSWVEAHSDSPPPSEPQHSVNTRGLARLSLDDDQSSAVTNTAKPKRPSLGPIRQSALKFTKDLQRESMTIGDTSDQNKDVSMQGLFNNEEEDIPKDVVRSFNADKTSTLSHDIHLNSTKQTFRIPVPRSTIYSEVQTSTSGLSFAIRSRRPQSRIPLRSTSSSAVMTAPVLKPDVKSSFYFGNSVQDETYVKPQPTSGTSSLKRKRRSSSVGPRLSLQGDERSRLSFLASDLYMQTNKQRKIERRTIVLTSIDQQSRNMCASVIGKLGAYTIGNDIDDCTTHIIVGRKRRTLSVAFGLLRGLWLVTVDWIKASAEKGYYVPEQDFEIIDWYPKCAHARLLAEKAAPASPGAKLLSSRRIYVGQTIFDCKLIKKLAGESGALLCESAEAAGLVIATQPHDNIPTVIENWLFDCIEQFEGTARFRSQRNAL